MRLSEGIRLGAMTKPQGFGELRSTIRSWFKKTESTCALGAAFDAAACRIVPRILPGTPGKSIRGGESATHTVEVPAEWAAVLATRVRCPACMDFMVYGPLDRIIAIHLNDHHKWTRERIADWVESIERERGLWAAESITIQPSDVVHLAEKLVVEI